MQITQKTVRTAKPKENPYELRDSTRKGFILRVQPSGKLSYICEYARGKRTTLGDARVLTLEMARDRWASIIGDYSKGIEPGKAKRKSKTLGDFLDSHFGPWAKENHSRPTEAIDRVKSCFPELLDKPIVEITSWHVEKFKSRRAKVGIKPGTINRDIATFKGVLSKAVKWGFIDKSPLQGFDMPKLDKSGVIRYLSTDEELRLLTALKGRDQLKTMVLVSLHTGIRFGELTALKWPDISFKQRLLTVRGDNSKNSQTRHIPLNDIAFKCLKEWHIGNKKNKYVFPGKSGGRLDNVRKSWLTVLSVAGIANYRWHDNRHTFASRLVMAGVDLNTIRELMGHSDIKMTLRYAHLAPEHKASAVEKLIS